MTMRIAMVVLALGWLGLLAVAYAPTTDASQTAAYSDR
mgnify:CR=1 FL=1